MDSQRNTRETNSTTGTASTSTAVSLDTWLVTSAIPIHRELYFQNGDYPARERLRPRHIDDMKSK